MYSSTFDYSNSFVGATYDMAYSDAIALPLLSTERLETLSVGGEYTRVEKTLRVADISDSYEFLDVCADGSKVGNCSRCWKCMRTLLTLDIAGLISRYSNLFDCAEYKRQRNMYIRKVLSSHDPLLREIVQFAKERHYTFPVSSKLEPRLHLQYFASYIKHIMRLPIRAARKLKRILSKNK